MSGGLFKDDVLFLQRLLSCCNLYGGKLDGKYGPITSAAEAAFDAQCHTIAGQVATFDPRTERNIRTLQTEVQKLCRQSLKRIRATGLDARVISGTRTYAEQAALFRQGRFGNAGPRVTNARAGQSWHNFGRAWDIGIFRADGSYITDGPQYGQASIPGKVPGIEWGGDWRTFKDMPHYQVTGELHGIAAMRDDFERGGR